MAGTGGHWSVPSCTAFLVDPVSVGMGFGLVRGVVSGAAAVAAAAAAAARFNMVTSGTGQLADTGEASAGHIESARLVI
jgi:hypothetical protein